MAKEIERKFLVKDDTWRKDAGAGALCRQGYLSLDRERVVRVRIKAGKATLTIKGVRKGLSAAEFEYPLPVSDAEEMLQEVCLHPLIEKIRYLVQHEGITWEVDEFLGDNSGLVLAEVELASEDQHVTLPAWAGPEVSEDRRYANASLVTSPFKSWS